MTRVRLAAAGVTALLLAVVSAPPAAAQIKGYEYFSPPPTLGPHALHDVDPDTGASSVPVENADCPAVPQDRVLSGVDAGSGMAFSGSVLFGLDYDGGLGPDIYLFRYLLDADSCTIGERIGGVPAPVGFTNLESLAFCPTNGKFYSASTPNNITIPGSLIEIDPLTGMGVVVGSPLPIGLFVRGMAHDPATGLLFAVGKDHAGEVSQLWALNKETAEATAVGPTGRNDLEGLALDLRVGAPRILAGGTEVYELDPSTGAATLVGGDYPGKLFAMASPRVPCLPDDPDRDGDGTPDCADDCPDDMDKTEPGDCGCGNVETGDSDGDGVQDCIDGCPDDMAKTEPGDCGCGTPETGDRDGDGVLDCNDGCPDDMAKTDPGECGCGSVETGDRDGDGVHDCNDGCPDDMAKTEPGDCGCGNVETGDRDGDGIPDCNDGCPDDMAKTDPGERGCGNLETGDSDGDGVHDCNDGCPSDPDKLEPGVCGCGLPDLDVTGDTVPDCTCQVGDVHPHGTGDGLVNAADWLIARRVTELGTLPEHPNDLRCGDAAPGTVDCHESSGTGHWCVTAADGLFGSADTLAIRPLAAGVHVASCDPCLSGSPDPEADLRLPGDVVPPPGVDVADVLQVLRWAVSLDDPPSPLTDPLRFCQADVAPTHFEGDLSVVDGDGSIDVADVLKILRFAVGLEELAWRERALQVVLRDAIKVLGFSARVSGWPAWAVVTGFEGSCDQGGGVDEVPGTCALTCASDPATVDGPDVVLGAFLYRGVKALDASQLGLSAQVVDETLSLPDATVELVTP